MSDFSQLVQDFMYACEALLKTRELTEAEIQVIEEMANRLSEKLFNDGKA